jgi:hypothetical protein
LRLAGITSHLGKNDRLGKEGSASLILFFRSANIGVFWDGRERCERGELTPRLLLQQIETVLQPVLLATHVVPMPSEEGEQQKGEPEEH